MTRGPRWPMGILVKANMKGPATKDQWGPGSSLVDANIGQMMSALAIYIFSGLFPTLIAPRLHSSSQGTTFPRLPCQLLWPVKGTGGRPRPGAREKPRCTSPSLCLPTSGEAPAPLMAVSFDSSSCQRNPLLQPYGPARQPLPWF